MNSFYNQTKIKNFLDNPLLEYGSYYDKEKKSHYHFIFENGIPVSNLATKKLKDYKGQEFYSVLGSYSQNGLGKILYALALMETNDNDTPFMSCDWDSDVRGYANNIWESIQKDSTVKRIEIEKEDFFGDFSDFAYQKDKDDFFHEVSKNKRKIIQEHEKELFYSYTKEVFHFLYEEILNSREENEDFFAREPYLENTKRLFKNRKETQYFYTEDNKAFLYIKDQEGNFIEKAQMDFSNQKLSGLQGSSEDIIFLLEQVFFNNYISQIEISQSILDKNPIIEKYIEFMVDEEDIDYLEDGCSVKYVVYSPSCSFHKTLTSKPDQKLDSSRNQRRAI